MSIQLVGVAGEYARLITGTPLTAPLTIYCWWRPDTAGAAGIIGIEKGDRREFLLDQRTGDGSIAYIVGVNAVTLAIGATIGSWGGLMLTLDASGNAESYLGPTESGSGTGAPIPTALVDFVIGVLVSWASCSTGRVAHFAAWESVLSRANYDSLIAGDNPNTVSPGTLIMYQPLEAGFDEVGYVGGTGWTVNGLTFDAAENPVVDAPPSSGYATAHLTWTLNSTNETSVIVDRKVNRSAWVDDYAVLGSGVTTYDDTNIDSLHHYDYRVSARNGVGDSANSNTASIGENKRARFQSRIRVK